MLGTSSFQQSSSVICVSNKLASQSSSDHINWKQSHCLQGCWCCSFCFVPLQRANVRMRQRTNPFLSLPFLPSLKRWVRVQFICSRWQSTGWQCCFLPCRDTLNVLWIKTKPSTRAPHQWRWELQGCAVPLLSRQRASNAAGQAHPALLW